MKFAIVIVVVFLLQFTNARPKVKKSFETPDGHMYKVQMDRSGKQIISRDDEDGEITVPLYEQRKWVVIMPSDNTTCYVIDMTEKEIQAKATDLDFETDHYEMKTGQEDVDVKVKETCEKQGRKGMDIIQLGPKEQTDTAPALSQGGRIVKRSWCVQRRCLVYRVVISGEPYIYVKCWDAIVYC